MNIVNNEWYEVPTSITGVEISSRLLHSCCAIESNLIIFGGIRWDPKTLTQQTLGDMYSIDTSTFCIDIITDIQVLFLL
jgi:hypothetical protein